MRRKERKITDLKEIETIIYSNAAIEKTVVIKVAIEHMTGKQSV
jgi:hypothetical protein